MCLTQNPVSASADRGREQEYADQDFFTVPVPKLL